MTEVIPRIELNVEPPLALTKRLPKISWHWVIVMTKLRSTWIYQCLDHCGLLHSPCELHVT